MAYTALYRKFRPNEFEEVKGQDAIVTTLRNQIKTGRIGHAYLFCGTRGTGKTTVAKIFAKAVNCENPIDGSPCEECRTCKEISAGVSMNVIEIDAASNNGVDNIREIREEVAYRPTEGKYKVYIIDEVHMLSIGAFNALLKTLEEPPEYVIFILATTEAHKIPVTILSRCQRYDFKRISLDTITNRLSELVEKEGLDVEEKALRYVARMADGSMRDALSLLDQCIAFYIGQRLTYEHVLQVLGAVDADVLGTFLRTIVNRDVKGAMDSIESLIMEGRELTQLAADLTWYLRNLLLIKNSDQVEDVVDASKETIARMKEEAGLMDSEDIFRYIRVFSDLTNQMRFSAQKRVLFEVAVIKLANPQMEQSPDALVARIKALEQEMKEKLAQISQGMVVLESPVPVQEQKAATEEKKVYPKALPEDVAATVKKFSIIKDRMPKMLGRYLEKATPGVTENGHFVITLDDEMKAAFVNTEEHKEEIKSVIQQETGKTVDIEIHYKGDAGVYQEIPLDFSDIHMDIIIEDE